MGCLNKVNVDTYNWPFLIKYENYVAYSFDRNGLLHTHTHAPNTKL